MTKEEYAADLDSNLSNLIGRLHRMAYKPQPVRRVYIPKPGSTKQRPLGIPCLEDKLVQAGLVRILNAVFEQDFIEDSYGFRPVRSCHQALRELSVTVESKPVNYIVEADIKGFFDNVNQEWLMKFLEHRIGDKKIQRMVKRSLKAGVLETPSGNLSKNMQHINGACTSYFNVKRKRSGHLFQGHYKAIVIEADEYVQELSRYIHLKPRASKHGCQTGRVPVVKLP